MFLYFAFVCNYIGDRMLSVAEPPSKTGAKVAALSLRLIQGTNFSCIKPMAEPLQSSEFARHKMPLESRMEAFSFWAVCRMKKNLLLAGPELDVHFHEISEAILEFRRLEPDAPVFGMAHESLKTAVHEAVMEVDGERFNTTFDALVRKWGETHPFLARDRSVYQISAEYLSAKAADKITNRLCTVLDALVESAIAEQSRMVA
jgi:hypothetical protein